MPFVIVIAPPGGHSQAAALAAELEALGITGSALDVSEKWNEDGWRSISALWPAGAFVVLCLTKGAARDTILNNVIWRAVPLDKDQTGRFVFAVFDPEAKEKFASFVEAQFSAPGGDAAIIADHIKRHEQAMADFLRQQEERRKALEEAVLRQPRPTPAPSSPRDIGGGEVGASEPRRRVEGIGAADGPVRVGGAGRRYDPFEELLRNPVPAPAPMSPPSGLQTRGAPATAPTQKAAAPAKLDKVDSMAFAPKKLRRGTTELIRVAIFQPKDRGRAAKAAKAADARTQSAGGAQALGQIERGTRIAAVIDARGALIEDMRLEAEWNGAPLDFNFPVEPSLDPAVAQAFFNIRILADDAQIGAITFVRPLIPPKKSGAASKLDSREKLRRVSRVFLSYSSS
ncbi:MAG: hypothetical protein ABWZ40_11605, partial [Caulobacterales bacterium]